MTTIKVDVQFLEELRVTLGKSYVELDEFLQHIPKEQAVPILQDIAGCIRGLDIVLTYPTQEN